MAISAVQPSRIWTGGGAAGKHLIAVKQFAAYYECHKKEMIQNQTHFMKRKLQIIASASAVSPTELRYNAEDHTLQLDWTKEMLAGSPNFQARD